MTRFSRLLLILAFLLAPIGMPAPRGAADELPGGSLAGQLLVAGPEMGDPRFAETVIYVVAHSDKGAFGVIINQPVKSVSFAELFHLLHLDSDAGTGSLSVHYGGPVEPGLGLILHSRDVTLGDADVVAGDLAATTEPEMLRRIASGKGPSRYLFALGYAGWAPGQLETELGRSDWFVIPADPSLIFTDHPEETWKRALARRSTTL
jgi:putative transcriptional regulator